MNDLLLCLEVLLKMAEEVVLPGVLILIVGLLAFTGCRDAWWR